MCVLMADNESMKVEGLEGRAVRCQGSACTPAAATGTLSEHALDPAVCDMAVL